VAKRASIPEMLANRVVIYKHCVRDSQAALCCLGCVSIADLLVKMGVRGLVHLHGTSVSERQRGQPDLAALIALPRHPLGFLVTKEITPVSVS
jgi:hypothetical protein